MRDSATDPLRIDPVALRGCGGRIGMTLCPGKKQPNARSGGWDRDLKTDLQAAAAFGAAAVVSLVETEEFHQMGVVPAEFGAICAELRMEWHHLPVRDVSVPTHRFEQAWSYAGLRLRAHLRAGRTVVLHCNGGRGRAGTVAARLLVEFGAPAEEAIAAVRAAREGAIETREQEDYVRRCRAGETRADLRNSQVAGCLFGGALGDAFGYPVEFTRLPVIRARYGPRGIQMPQFRDGRLVVSDDTQLTLFTLEGLLRGLGGGEPVEDIRRAYLDWLDTQGYGPPHHRPFGDLAGEPALRAVRDPGTTCVNALQNGGRGTTARPLNRSKGCGGVMRVAPIGLFPDRLSISQAFEMGMKAAALTHGHPTGYLSAGVMAATVRGLMEGMALRDAVVRSLAELAAFPGQEETRDAVERALGPVARVQDLGEGWVGEEALAIGLHAALQAETFPAALALAANHDGDSDSTAGIAGQLWGAWKGVADIPHPWITALDVFGPMMGLLWRMFGSRFSTASRSW